jgi:hypothetical protein
MKGDVATFLAQIYAAFVQSCYAIIRNFIILICQKRVQHATVNSTPFISLNIFTFEQINYL